MSNNSSIDNKEPNAKDIMDMTLRELLGSDMDMNALMEQANVALQKKDDVIKLELARPDAIITLEKRNPNTPSEPDSASSTIKQPRVRGNRPSNDALKPQINEMRLAGLTQKEVASQLAISQSLVSKLERKMKSQGQWKDSTYKASSLSDSIPTSTSTTE